MTKVPALFLDRDGVLIHNGRNVNDKSQIRLIRAAGNALAEFNNHQIPVILLVEQPSSKKTSELLTRFQAYEIEAELKRKLNRLNAYYTTMFILPKPQDLVTDYQKKDFEYRLPNTHLIEKAAELSNIDIRNSWIITDRFDTLLAAKNAKMFGGILVRTGKGKAEEKILAKNIESLHPLEVDVYSSLHIARTTVINYFKKFYLENNLHSSFNNLNKIKVNQELS